MNIYIDFDRTLFNTDLFFKKVDYLLKINDVNLDIIYKYRKEPNEEGFNLFNTLKLMEQKYPFNHDVYEEVEGIFKNSNNYVYSDTYEFLEKIKEKKYKLILLTKGNKDFQMKKINNTNLLKYFDEVNVTIKDKGLLDIDYQKGIFIDDNPYEILSIMKRNPQRVIRIKRDNTKYCNINIEGIFEEVESFNEIRV